MTVMVAQLAVSGLAAALYLGARGRLVAAFRDSGIGLPTAAAVALSSWFLPLVAALGLAACGDTVGYSNGTGDKIRGKELFTKGCGSCHMIKGKGSVLGPDLSNLAGTRKVQNIVDALTKANHKILADGGTHDSTLVPNTSYQPARVTTADGKVISGILKNEDSFSLQMLGKDDLTLHRFKRKDVKVYYDPQSLMPHDWDKRLSPTDFQNLLAFLTRLHVPPPPAPPGRGGGAPVG